MRADDRAGRDRSSCCCRGRTSICWASGSPRSTAPPRWPTTWPRRPPRPSRAVSSLEHHQTNHEGELVELVHGARGRAAALIVNAGALTHYSWSLHDALAAFDGVVVELHLSNPAAREPWRHTSVVAPVADGSIAGFGGLGYRLAVQAVARLLDRRPGPGVTRATASAASTPRWRLAGRRPPGAAAARLAGGRGRRAARHHPGQRPLPDGFSGSAGAAARHRGRGPARDRRPLPDPGGRAARARRATTASVELCVGGAAGPARRHSPTLARRPASRLGLEADNVTWGGQAPVGRGPRSRRARGHQSVWSRRCDWSRTPARWPGWPAPPPSPTPPWARCCPCWARGAPRRRWPWPSTPPCAASVPRTAPSRPSWRRARTRPSPTPGPPSRAIVAGDPVVIDFGATFDGYRSDMTRTFCVGGEPSGTLARVFDVVAEAQAAGVAAVRRRGGDGRHRQGVPRRDRRRRAGATPSSTAPGTGSGSTSTRPRRWVRGRLLSSTPGVVVTVEPGVYLAGVGGVRIEDTVVVTDHGCRPLTRFTKDIAA